MRVGCVIPQNILPVLETSEAARQEQAMNVTHSLDNSIFREDVIRIEIKIKEEVTR